MPSKTLLLNDVLPASLALITLLAPSYQFPPQITMLPASMTPPLRPTGKGLMLDSGQSRKLSSRKPAAPELIKQ